MSRSRSSFNPLATGPGINEWHVDHEHLDPQRVVRREPGYRAGQTLRGRSRSSSVPSLSGHPHQLRDSGTSSAGYIWPNFNSLSEISQPRSRNSTRPFSLESSTYQSEEWDWYRDRGTMSGGHSAYDGWYSAPPTPGPKRRKDERVTPPNGFLPGPSMDKQGMSLAQARSSYQSSIKNPGSTQETWWDRPGSSIAGPSASDEFSNSQAGQTYSPIDREIPWDWGPDRRPTGAPHARPEPRRIRRDSSSRTTTRASSNRAQSIRSFRTIAPAPSNHGHSSSTGMAAPSQSTRRRS